MKRESRKRNSKRNRSLGSSIEEIPIQRLKIVFALLSLGIFLLMGRMAWLQVFQTSKLEARARSLQTKKTKPLGTRRSIVDRRGRLVAIDEERFRLWAHPKYFNFPGDNPSLLRKPIEVAAKLSKVINISKEEILGRLANRASGVRLLDGLDPEIAYEIKQLGISGLDLEPYPQRVYPQGNLFANVVGFLNQDREPQAGLEQSLNEKLLRIEKTTSIRRGADGTPLPDDLSPGIFSKDDVRLHLTLDARLQELALNALSDQVKLWKAEKGVALVMDVNNGELLALASSPTYDPNTYWKFSPSLFREWSIQDLFEPGSTFKPINLAIALEENVISPGGYIDDTGKLDIGGWSIFNFDKRANGKIDFARVLQVSSNVGMVKIMQRLDSNKYWDWLHRLGVDMQPFTDLPGAVPGYLKPKEYFVSKVIEPATASYGQGFSLTPLKLAQLHALISNGGYLVDPHITKGLYSSKQVKTSEISNKQKMLRPDVTNTILNWMESVVNYGSGKGVKTDGYQIGGKTGTAQKALNGIYQPGLKICSFVAVLPINDPKYVVLVVVDEPRGENAYGSTVAVPVAKKIIDGLIVLEKILPTDDMKKMSSNKI